MNKKIKKVILAVMLGVMIMPNMVFAESNEKVERNFTIDISNPNTKEVKKDNGFNVEVKKKEVVKDKKKENKDDKTKEEIKIQTNENNISKEDLDEAIEKAKSEMQKYITKPSKARGTVTENVGVDNKDYPIRQEISNKVSTTETGEKLVDRPAADKRQFLTFTTKTGKVFHLIIDYDKDEENVQLLTEVSEEDLLNMILSRDNNGQKKIQKTEPVKEVKKEENPVKEEPKKEKSGMGTYLIFGLVLLGAIGAGYYFKVLKPKDEEGFTDDDLENEDDEFFSEAQEVDEYEEVEEEMDENMEDK